MKPQGEPEVVQMKRRKGIPCRRSIAAAGPEAVSGSDNGKGNALQDGSKRWV